MVIHIFFKKLTLIWPSDLGVRDKVSLNFETDLRLRFDYQGDSSRGPGFSNLEIELDILKGFEKSLATMSSTKPTLQTRSVFEEPQVLDQKNIRVGTNSTKEGAFVRDKKKKGKSETSPVRNSMPESPNSGNMVENITLSFQQRYEIKTCTRHFLDEKADYITKISMSKKGEDSRKSCDFNIPVVLLNHFSALFSVISSSSADKIQTKNKERSTPKAREDSLPIEDSYNQIYEFSLPWINILLLSEYKGEELIKVEIKNIFMYFRREQKKSPRSIQDITSKGNLLAHGVDNRLPRSAITKLPITSSWSQLATS